MVSTPDIFPSFIFISFVKMLLINVALVCVNIYVWVSWLGCNVKMNSKTSPLCNDIKRRTSELGHGWVMPSTLLCDRYYISMPQVVHNLNASLANVCHWKMSQVNLCLWTDRVSTKTKWHQCRTWIKSMKHDDVIKWKQFPRYWPFVRGIH